MLPARPAFDLLVLAAATAAASVALAAGPQPMAADEPTYVHVLQPGDTLIGLGRRYLVEPGSWPELAHLNQVRQPRRMPIGSSLRIPLRLMRTEPGLAIVTSITGSVRGTDAPLIVGQTLPQGSELNTGSDSHATVRLVDGTLLRLRSSGRVRIDEARRVTGTGAVRSGVQLDRGRVEIDAQPARGGQPGFRITTPQGVLGVRGTQFRVEADGALTRGEVLEGTVAVSGTGAAGNKQRVAAGFGTVVDAAGRVAQPVALLPAPDTSQLPVLYERPLVRLRLPAQPGAVAYRVLVARDETFDAVLADVRSATPELRIAGLPDGRYPMRLRATDAQGLEGRDARALLQLKAQPEPPLPRTPTPRAVISGTRVDFAWTASSEAQRYRLQLARTISGGAEFAVLDRDLKDLQAVAQSLDPLPPGAYVWRLASVRADGDQGPFGDAQSFELRAPPPQPAPPSPPTVGDGSVHLSWQGLPGQTFELQVARDAVFTQIVTALTLDRNQIELPLTGAGRFHVRLRARDADGFVGPWSASQSFDVIPCVRDARDACVRAGNETLQLQ